MIRIRSWAYIAMMALCVLVECHGNHDHHGHGDDNVVTTPLGKLRGYNLKSRSGRTFLGFSGVPYAKPPVDSLRFEPPQPLKPWTGVKDALEDGPNCAQYSLYALKPKPHGVEDCLYLTLYTHSTNGSAAVLVHYHGGGFMGGNGAKYKKPHFLMDEDVVIVMVNYRVGILGFLSFEDLTMPGNQGLKDQAMALRWVQQNIASFGGDPNRVTLVGESAGGGSVYHHTVSPLSKGLFHGGIAQSGSSYNPWVLYPPGVGKKLATKLTGLLDCPSSPTSAAVACLKGKDPMKLVEQVEQYREWQIDPISNFSPVLEPAGPGAFLTGPISKWEHNPVPLMTGTTSAEGLLRTYYISFFNTTWPEYNAAFDKIAPISLLYYASSSNPNKVTKAVREYYFSNREITENDWFNVTQMYTDTWFTQGILEGANKHSGNVYFYYFDYLGVQALAEHFNKTLLVGGDHEEEIPYIWNSTWAKELKGEDLKMSKTLVDLWTGFAKTGTPPPVGKTLQWDKWTPEHHRYLNINNEGFKMEEGLAEDRYRFWNSLSYRDKFD